MLCTALLSLSAPDLARPSTASSVQLSDAPNIWMTHDFLSSEAAAHMRSKVPKDESAYSPCIGQVDEFDSKKCTILPVAGDELLEAAVDKVGAAWNMDVSWLRKVGLPIIRYLPGAPPVGKHGDEDKHGVVPNATLVVYLTASSSAGAPGGQTIFPEAGVAVTPKPGSILAFQNVDEHGAPHPRGKHTVSAVPADSPGDRLIVQIPIYQKDGVRKAFPEHVSGNKKPGEHESMHGTAEQIAAGKAALAAGFGIAIAFMAAKAGKFDEADVPALKKQAEDTGKFAPADFEPKQ